MKKEVTISLVAILALCGCQNKELDVRTLESKPFIATIDDNYLGAETKTSLDNQGNVLWKQGDQISIFAGSTINEQYQVSDDSDGKTAAKVNKVSGDGFNAGGEIDNNVAFYPYSSTASIAKNGNAYIISDVTLPSTQNYAEASFGNGAFPMAAITSSTTDMNLKFKNILGALKLQLKGTASIASISISGNNDEILCGAAEVTVSASNTPSINLTDASAKTVTLDCGTGVQLNTETATLFIISLPPMTMTGGFTVTVIDTEGKQMEIKTTKSQTIARSGLLKMPSVDFEGHNIEPLIEYVDLGLPTLWATCNIGASSPEQQGYDFAWGETEPKSEYSEANYKWSDGSGSYSEESITKYNYDDEKEILDPEDDAATIRFGNEWSTPTSDDWYDLYSHCTFTRDEINGIQGFRVTSNIPGYTDKSIFFADTEDFVGYWSSNIDYDDITDATRCYMWFYDDYLSVNIPYPCPRFLGLKIRPVSHRECNHNYLILQKGLAPTHFIAGYKDCYRCGFCGKYFEDSEGKIEIGNYSAYISWQSSTGAGYLNPVPYENDYVDLGLSVKWATCNVGARSPEQFGNYYAWGETETKSRYDGSTYMWCVNGDARFQNTKYISTSTHYPNDYKTVLDPEDDAAYVNVGESWRTPTKAQWEELISNCTIKDYTLNGIQGALFTSKISGYTGEDIFIPLAGYYQETIKKRYSGDKNYTYPTGYYMTSSWYDGYYPSANSDSRFYYVDMYGNFVSPYLRELDRCYGVTVRAVKP